MEFLVLLRSGRNYSYAALYVLLCIVTDSGSADDICEAASSYGVEIVLT